MSDFPELCLFDEIEDLSRSEDFFTFTKDQFNKTWAYYEDETEAERRLTDEGWTTPPHSTTLDAARTSSNNPLPPQRDLWDPMLCDRDMSVDLDLAEAAENSSDREVPDTSITLLPPLLETPVMDVADLMVSSSKPSSSSCSVFEQTAIPANIFETCTEGSNKMRLIKPLSVRAANQSSASRRRPPSPKTLKSRYFSPRKQKSTTTSRRSSSQMAADMSAAEKVKLYEMPQFRDPKKERCRLNAINSKINRDRKKWQLEEAAVAITALQQVNQQLARDSAKDRRRLVAARMEIKQLRKKLACV